MRIKGKEIKIKQIFYLVLYYGFARYLPKSNTFGNIGGEIRYLICKQIFKRCGKHVNIERKAYFASGVDIEIGELFRYRNKCPNPQRNNHRGLCNDGPQLLYSRC